MMKQWRRWGGVPIGVPLTIDLYCNCLHAWEETSNVPGRPPRRNDVGGHLDAPVSPNSHRRRGEFCWVWAALYRGAVGPEHEQAHGIPPLIHSPYQCRCLTGGEVQSDHHRRSRVPPSWIGNSREMGVANVGTYHSETITARKC